MFVQQFISVALIIFDCFNVNFRPADVSGLPLSVTTGRGIMELEAQIQNTVSEATGRKKRLLRVPMSGHHLQYVFRLAADKNQYSDVSI